MNVALAPGATSPVSNFLVVDVIVWATESLLATVTVAPGDTRRVAGEKVKFLMVMVVAEAPAPPELPAALDGLDGLDPQAATKKAQPTSALVRTLAVRTRRDRPCDPTVVRRCWSLEKCIMADLRWARCPLNCGRVDRTRDGVEGSGAAWTTTGTGAGSPVVWPRRNSVEAEPKDRVSFGSWVPPKMRTAKTGDGDEDRTRARRSR